MAPSEGKILIVDDDPAMRRLFRTLLSTKYQIFEAGSGEQGIEIAGAADPDLVLLDIDLPGLSGYDCVAKLKSTGTVAPQVIMVSGKSSVEEQSQAFECGADDYLIKPVAPAELRSRVQLHFQLRESQAHTSALQNEVDSHHAALRLATQEHIENVIAVQDIAARAIAKVAESRDNDTGKHIVRMRDYAYRIAEELCSPPFRDAHIDASFLADLQRSAPLHDIGKVAIPDSILLKPGRLTEDEFEVMKRHSEIGAKILEDLVFESQHAGFLAMAESIARSHHERWDGKGYPNGLAGEEIPLSARIIAVADVYDALTSERPYKEAWSPIEAKKTIDENAGTQFDPIVTRAFDSCFEDILKIQMRHADTAEVAETALALLQSDAFDGVWSVSS